MSLVSCCSIRNKHRHRLGQASCSILPPSRGSYIYLPSLVTASFGVRNYYWITVRLATFFWITCLVRHFVCVQTSHAIIEFTNSWKSRVTLCPIYFLVSRNGINDVLTCGVSRLAHTVVYLPLLVGGISCSFLAHFTRQRGADLLGWRRDDCSYRRNCIFYFTYFTPALYGSSSVLVLLSNDSISWDLGLCWGPMT